MESEVIATLLQEYQEMAAEFERLDDSGAPAWFAWKRLTEAQQDLRQAKEEFSGKQNAKKVKGESW